jgi:1,4-dihydroxy-2-naphthoyl-CoA hydrolase
VSFTPEQLAASMPLFELLGARIEAASPEEVRGALDWDESRCTAGGILHGGALMALADGCGGVCAFLNLPDGAGGTATIESKTNFFRPVSSGTVHATSTLLNRSRSTITVDTQLRNDEGKLVARVTQTQAVL